MTETPHSRQLIARDIADAVRLRRCLNDAVSELEIAIGFSDWNGVRRALELLQNALFEDG